MYNRPAFFVVFSSPKSCIRVSGKDTAIHHTGGTLLACYHLELQREYEFVGFSMLDSACWIPHVGFRMLDSACWISVLDFGVGFRCWISENLPRRVEQILHSAVGSCYSNSGVSPGWNRMCLSLSMISLPWHFRDDMQ